ncbi:MAG: hypothetical protein ACE5HV_00165 [Acidobacteriota bacterium]
MGQGNLEGGSLKDMFMKNIKLRSRTETLAAGLTLVADDPPLQFLNNGGAVRTVVLPAEALSDGLVFIITNSGGGAFAITINDDTPALVASLLQNESAICFCDGTSWFGLVGTST